MSGKGTVVIYGSQVNLILSLRLSIHCIFKIKNSYLKENSKQKTLSYITKYKSIEGLFLKLVLQTIGWKSEMCNWCYYEN